MDIKSSMDSNRLKKLSKTQIVTTAIFFILLILLMWRNDEVNELCNNLIAPQSTEVTLPQDGKEQAALALVEDVVLTQRITTQGRAIRLGIRFGTYIRTNHARYEVELHTLSGLLIAKDTIYADKLIDNEYAWIAVPRGTVAGGEYQLTINAYDVPAGNEIAIYYTKQEDTEFNLGGEVYQGSIVVGYDYVIEESYFGLVIAIWFFCFLFLMGWKLWKNIAFAAIKHIKAFFLFNKAKVYLGIIGCGILGCLITVVVRKTEYQYIYHTDSGMQAYVVPMEPEQEYRQEIAASGWNRIGVRLATYTDKYPSGDITIRLYHADTLLEERKEKAEKIRDNQYLYINFNKEYTMEDMYFTISVHLPEEYQCGIYYVSEQEMVYQLNQSGKRIDWFMLILFGSIVLSGILLYLGERNKKWRKWLSLVGFAGIGALIGGLAYTYYIFQTVNTDALRKSFGTVESTDEQFIFEEEDCEAVRTEYKEYYLSGSVGMHFIYYTVSGIGNKIDSVALKVDPDSIPRAQQSIRIYYDTGAGFNSKEKMSFAIVYQGEENIIVPFDYTGNVKSIRVDLGADSKFTKEIEGVAYKVSGIKVNFDSIVSGQERVLFLLIGCLIGSFLWVWKEQSLQDKISQYCSKKRIRHEVVFLLLSLVFGSMIALIIPVMQIPDEGSHMNMSLGIYGEMANRIGESVTHVGEHAGNHVNMNDYKDLLTSRSEKLTMRYGLRNIAYPGQTIGAVLANSMRLPVFWIFTLAEAGALLLYSIIGYFTIKRMPFHKTIMMALLLMPMMLQQAGSWSYDSFNSALSFYLVAYIFYLKYREDKVQLKNLIKIMIISLLLLYIKKVYVILALLIVIIPLEQYDIRIGKFKIDVKKIIQNKAFWIGAGGLVLVIGIAGLYIISGYDSGRMMIELVKEPEQFLLLISKSIVMNKQFYYESLLGNFGWLDLRMNSLFYLGVPALLCCITFMGHKDGELTVRRTGIIGERWVMGGILAVGIVLIFSSMLEWTLVIEGLSSISLEDFIYVKNIEGVQGRYFLPILPLLFLLPNIHKGNNKYKYLIFGIYFLLIPAYVVGQLYNRYW